LSLKITRPSSFVEGNAATKFPLIVILPTSPIESFVGKKELELTNYLVSIMKVVVITIQSRGSEGLQENVRQSLIGQVGRLDVNDMNAGIKAALSSISYLDPHKVGLIGSHYGGFLATLLMETDELRNFELCTAIDTPIVNWRNYDSLVSDYLFGSGDKSLNSLSYENVLLTHLLRNISKHNLLLTQEIDDAVSKKDQLSLVNTLVSKNTIFEHQVYWNQNSENSLMQKEITEHYYATLSNFLDKCLFSS